ncbi:MAG: PIN domain-containing protein [Acidobacteria bacterium]|nr:MAG: PIN domain-containing protein [Acidobacteriota bacterium]
MILVDANLLIYAVNSDAPRHARVRAWLEKELSSETEVGLAWVVVLAFLRVITKPGILAHPLAPEAALRIVDGWFQQPYVVPVSPGPNHWPLLRQLVSVTGTAGNLTTDAHLAAMALERGCTLYSCDYDFRRYPNIMHADPLA